MPVLRPTRTSETQLVVLASDDAVTLRDGDTRAVVPHHEAAKSDGADVFEVRPLSNREVLSLQGASAKAREGDLSHLSDVARSGLVSVRPGGKTAITDPLELAQILSHGMNLDDLINLALHIDRLTTGPVKGPLADGEPQSA